MVYITTDISSTQPVEMCFWIKSSLSLLLFFNPNRPYFTEANFAISRPAYSSSREGDGYPSLAVDGNSDPDRKSGGSCAATRKELHPWWAVDLQRPVEVMAIDITNHKLYGNDVSNTVPRLCIK